MPWTMRYGVPSLRAGASDAKKRNLSPSTVTVSVLVVVRGAGLTRSFFQCLPDIRSRPRAAGLASKDDVLVRCARLAHLDAVGRRRRRLRRRDRQPHVA